MKKYKIELRKGVEIKRGDYLRTGDEPFVILIKKIREDEHPTKGKILKVSYTAFELVRLTKYSVEDRPEHHFLKDFEKAEVLSKDEFEKIWKEYEAPISREKETEMTEAFKKAVRAKNLDAAENHLKTYFQTVVLREPGKVSKYLEMRKAIPSVKYRPCICLEDYDERVLKRFFEKLPDNFWNLIPENLITKIGKSRDLSNYQPDIEDAKLKQLIKPFTGDKSYQLSLLGVNFDKQGITATNAQILLFLPKIKEGKKGVYCMTSKCFKENQGEVEVEQHYPKYAAVMPKKETKYITFDIEVAPLISLIKTFHTIGFKPKNVLIFTFKIGDKMVSLNAKDILQPVLETMRKLGHETVKFWFEASDKAVVITPKNTSREAMLYYQSEIILAMPFFRGKTKGEIGENMIPGDILFDVRKKELRFHGSKHVHQFEKYDDKTKIILLAKAKAAAQKQRIRIIELQKQAA